MTTLKRDTERCIKSFSQRASCTRITRNSSREGIAVKPFSSSCHFYHNMSTVAASCAYIDRAGSGRSIGHTCKPRHTLTDTKTSESLDKLPGEKKHRPLEARLFRGGVSRSERKKRERRRRRSRRREIGVKDRIHHGLGSGIVRVNSGETQRDQPRIHPRLVNTYVPVNDASIILICKASISTETRNRKRVVSTRSRDG